MNITYNTDNIAVTGPGDFSAEKIFNCGQCFRWAQEPDGSWLGAAKGRVLRLREADGGVIFECGKADFLNIWYDYFDLGRDYAAVRRRLSQSAYMARACDFGAGIRILRQDPWEALCTFIISQCNNIARITGIADRLCRLFGDALAEGLYSFPGPERLCGLCEDDLTPLRAGYRAQYILAAARAVCDGTLDLARLCDCGADAAEAALTALPGIGRKVASCVMLFGLGHTAAFPVDTWMRKALDAHFAPGFDPSVFGDDAGFAQQYIFYYARWGHGGEASGKCDCEEDKNNE